MKHRLLELSARPIARHTLAGLLLTAVGVVGVGAVPTQDTDAGIDGTRAALEKWVETRRIISQERRDWELGREMLEERMALVRREIEGTRANIDAAKVSLAEADAKRAELFDENARLQAASRALGETVTALEARLRTLLAQLPEPLVARVKPLSQRIPEDPAASKSSLSERFANVVGILNEVDKFSREITLTSEVRTLADGTSAEVTALYIGVSQGFYATASGFAAGRGTGTPEGWKWTPLDATAAAEVARAIAIAKGESMASFVRLPIRIQ